MSDDGSVVAFESGDGNVVTNDGNPDSDVFVRELTAGSAELVSVHDPSLPSRDAQRRSISGVTASSLSADGRYLAFFSDADNLHSQRYERLPRRFCARPDDRHEFPVSLNTNGVTGDSISTDPAISGNGRYVAFSSSADDLVANVITTRSTTRRTCSCAICRPERQPW